MLRVSEVFRSIQGETSRAGRPCVFIRLAGCNLNCRWCDTRYAREGGDAWTLADLLDAVDGGPQGVCVTGGEPLLQEETPALVRALLDRGRSVAVETNGSLPIEAIDARASRALDLKAPSSGETEKMLWSNLDLLTPRDEVKIVIADRSDYTWAAALLARDRRLAGRTVNLSPAQGMLGAAELAEWILADRLEVRLNVQLHRILWPDAGRGR
ncbi:MAG TPA: radical SAM protein [Planctomycetota bacterium]|jgi:7-carboxy-7-deazaguanine synthase|nr:radical SAM protein [Planctomycetota bacterium]OQC22119.1 MAG: 7-carboxy-7-deazaguanine synthase [Planctomycetes bacterium ADurb.Bin069]HNS00379.1 radical SAM protein [Planctomycetota bacterium]HNU25747.1 radical SAM protein [Planctomycetota bacterium]HOE28699.1 radical SAM protein [Planctomycetota bacterium]